MSRIRGRRLQTRRRRYLAEHPLCARCDAFGRTSEAVELDHVVPLAKGGTDDESNLQGLCVACHKAKTIEDFGHRPRQRFGPDGFPTG